MTTLNTRQTVALVALFVLTSIAFIQLDNRQLLEPVKDIFSTVLSPVSSTFSRLGADRDQTELERELAAVKAQRDTLAAEAAQLRNDNRELDQMRQQLKLQTERPTWTLLQARVQNADPSSQQLMITVNKGRADGVREGMAVVAQGPNYIGQVTEVWERSARVMLIIDASQRVGARLDNGADGVIYGMSRFGGWMELKHLSREANPSPGELVLTADNAAVSTAGVPGGLIVGQVDPDQDLTPDPQGDSQSVYVIPFVNFESLQVVTIVLTDDDD